MAIAMYLFSAMANSVLMIGFKNINKKLTLPQKLYIYLSITDAATSLLVAFFVAYDLSSSSNNCTRKSIGMALTAYTFCVGLGTFFLISFLRNNAMRKPFNVLRNRNIYYFLIAWNGLMILVALFTFFTYKPQYTSHTLYIVNWLLTGSVVVIFVVLITYLNISSKRVLVKEAHLYDRVENGCWERRRKRNETAVAILNIITLIYAVCTLPLGIYILMMGILTLQYEDHKNFCCLYTTYFH